MKSFCICNVVRTSKKSYELGRRRNHYSSWMGHKIKAKKKKNCVKPHSSLAEFAPRYYPHSMASSINPRGCVTANWKLTPSTVLAAMGLGSPSQSQKPQHEPQLACPSTKAQSPSFWGRTKVIQVLPGPGGGAVGPHKSFPLLLSQGTKPSVQMAKRPTAPRGCCLINLFMPN